MQVRYRITILFTGLVLLILALVCSSVYYFSYQNRFQEVKRRLTNRSITASRLLSQSGIGNLKLIQQIDAASTASLKNKVVEVYDERTNRIYRSGDHEADSIRIPSNAFEDARKNGRIYFSDGDKDVVAYHHADGAYDVVILEAGFDEEGRDKLRQLRIILGLSFMGGIAITLVVGYVFSKRLLRPLRKITDEVNEISAQNLTRRISNKSRGSRDEWAYLSVTLNRLLNRLQDSFEMQGRFIANASHELTTPLTSISSQLEIALQRDRDSTYYGKILQSVFDDVQHLSKLTVSLLEFAKASGTSSGLEIEIIRIDEILMRLPAELAKTDAGYQIALDFHGLPDQEECLLLHGNAELLFSALKNIVVNACKHSDDHRALVRLEVDHSGIRVSVSDKGHGIADEEIERVLQPFYRTTDARSRDGFGLGLPLSSRIIKLHKGELTLVSRVHEGTTVIILLPVAPHFSNG